MDPYVYPGTNVLRNLRNIRDPEELNIVEGIATTRRLAELARKPIHGYLFQDLYSWAGEFRTVNISKGNDLFGLKQHIIPSLNKTFEDLNQERHLSGTDLKRFCNRGAHYLGEINAIHPFREGNGRTQREFIRQLASQNGYALDWSRVSRDQMMDASKQSFRTDNDGLEQVLRSALNI